MTNPTLERSGTLELRGLTKSFGQQTVLDGISLNADQGEFISLVGPSGCGKTTTLNIIAGFEEPDGGDVLMAGRSFLNVPSYRRQLGMVFQSHALFPNMTIFDNVAFGLSVRGAAKDLIAKRVGETLEMVQLSTFAKRYPRELSGGQQQRVGIARALAVQPRIILMDEPLSSLDAKLRREMQVDIKRIQRSVGITAIYVTHDQEEALTLSDRVVLMNRGRIEQDDTPEAIYRSPANAFVAGFIGESSFLTGEVLQGGQQGIVRLNTGEIVTTAAANFLAGSAVKLAVRPDKVKVGTVAGEVDNIAGTVVARAFLGTTVRYAIALSDGSSLMAHLPVETAVSVSEGDNVFASVSPENWRLFPENAT